MIIDDCAAAWKRKHLASTPPRISILLRTGGGKRKLFFCVMGECYIEQLMMTALRRGAILLGIYYLPGPQCYREPAVEDESCSFDDV